VLSRYPIGEVHSKRVKGINPRTDFSPSERTAARGGNMTNPTTAVIRVGDGRGFVVKDLAAERRGFHWKRIVITAAHCLPFFPPCHAASDLEERTYRALLGPLGREPTVWAECLFADPIADVAILGGPDNQVLLEEHEKYVELVEAVEPLVIARAPKKPTSTRARARLLSLNGRWFECGVRWSGGFGFWIDDAAEGIVGGMSGSPILDENGQAVGMVTISAGSGDRPHTEGGPNPCLAYALPARFVG
jgi:hypothetical protein